MSIKEEIQKRRTFAIISHPDAGKTTLTEKFLLYGGAVQQAGSVTARKNQRASTSDWMELERKRGISITSTVLQFDYDNYRINLLDTPGHEDFSEDTYRILTAVDAVVMVIDAAKGIEAQTRKLFEVCSKRKIPIFTFINKLDRPAREPIELLDEIEDVLKIGTFAVNWPLGTGLDFRGVFDRINKEVHLFERTTGGIHKAAVSITDLNDKIVKEKLSDSVHKTVMEEIEMLDIAGEEFDLENVMTGQLTPVFFGSAMNNFGVQLLLDGFLKYSFPPGAMNSEKGLIEPETDSFSGFVFKIQANMDPKHRDRIAFIRICSGKFAKNILVNNSRTNKKIRLASAHTVFGQQRESVEEAYPGDIVGLIGSNNFSIGDTLTEDDSIVYKTIPQFAPEHFITLTNPNTSDYKKFRDGLEQLLQEGVVQSFQLRNSYSGVIVLGAVGPLQFEVVQYRLKSEYSTDSISEPTNWSILRWVSPDVDYSILVQPFLPVGSVSGEDKFGNTVVLFTSEWSLQYFAEKHPEISLSDTPFVKEIVTK
ncbi:MAG: peptide chain release factor 3 [Candidatus Sericytochromatia bacterium]|nr:peptide chain release factor 3 [Candidatus Sericytochromatia bacterium]